MSSPKESLFAQSFAQKLVAEQFLYSEQPAVQRPSLRERLSIHMHCWRLGNGKAESAAAIEPIFNSRRMSEEQA